ncbi:zinc-binding dehydrogenase [Fimbriimonas ginsengisoli]|uniref:Zinc-containing alcohol dehydrogenase n=1 Tax=Fimbriimonas ginsengisoli Gsoil 348 TaxID=661478 RepID=A0A068NW17_FIMGI|nr:Zn-dependent alcohol dehydrogenase [Fimbriimonas ginsengisoli]AIE85804.1 zinc-containing alcohol dehydrogenase [Fimbriimonas ginsengisoli Gsoil 348]
MKIKAAVFRSAGVPFSVETLDLESPRAGEVLVRIRAVGVCHSDWHLMTGATQHPLPAVPGHEGAGVVEAIGERVGAVSVGDHVALNWAPNCGECFYCQHGRPSLCAAYVEPIWAGTMLDDTTRLSQNGEPVYHFSALACFAEHAVVPQECCVPMPKELPFPIAAVIGCAVTTGVGSVLNTAKVPAGSSVAVFGAGGVGLSTIMGARVAGAARIIAVDVSEEKLTFARGFGATDGLTAGPGVVAAIQSMTEGRGADFVFEAVGIPSVQEQCLEAVRPGGTVVFSGISPMGSATNLPGAVLTRQEKTVMGSYYGTSHAPRDFPLYAEMYRHGQLDLDRLISRTYLLEEINEAYADMLGGQGGRGVVVFP